MPGDTCLATYCLNLGDFNFVTVGHLRVCVSKNKWLEWSRIVSLPVWLATSYGET